ncbi:MAG: SGNH/GDSL hydrolase family protein [Clostridia bacterium]|nr:SGNH/GDSL hydrolase family protein [Clostridia bacterium]
MQFFKTYSSNTTAGTGNQCHFASPGGGVGRVYYKVRTGGKYNYSFLWSNILDSTFSNGAEFHKNLICDSWVMESLRVGVCTGVNPDDPIELVPVTFGGKLEKEVAPGEFFASDPVSLSPNAGDYICLEIAFRGDMIPFHQEIQIATYRKDCDIWSPSNLLPVPGMVGCDRPVKTRVAFFGDSITQGIGPAFNSYTHWNAVVAQGLPQDVACWNVGLGYGRAEDAASGGAWMFKALQNDLVVVCFGVNDIHQHENYETTRHDLEVIVNTLKGAGKKVLLQTIPPFDYNPKRKEIWLRLNHYIKTELAPRVDAIFDTVPILSPDSDHPEIAKYGGHPNEEGCRAWGEALAPVILQLLTTMK